LCRWLLSLVDRYYYQRLMQSMRKSGFKPLFFAEAFSPLNASGVDLSGSDIIFDAWDEGTPGSAAPILQAPGAKVVVSSYCFLCPTNSCPDNLVSGVCVCVCVCVGVRACAPACVSSVCLSVCACIVWLCVCVLPPA
jgi:hypothetical protein